MSPETLWSLVRDCFEIDDGSSPTIALVDLEPDEVGNLYRAVRSGTHLVDNDASFWDYHASADVPLDSVPNAALLVAHGTAAGFGFAVKGLNAGSVCLPNLGFQVFRTVFSLHYQMGASWGPAQVFALFGWLRDCLRMTKHGNLDLKVDGPPDVIVFQSAWDDFVGTE